MKNKIESGHSILEMLGVLAIIGVLSIFVLNIYSYLIDKLHANILSDEILQRSLEVEKQLDNRKKNVSLAKFSPKSKLGYNMTYDNISIGLQIFDVPKKICDMTLDNIKNTLDVKIYSTDGQLLEECEENNKLTVLFKKTTTNTITKECPADTPKGANPNTCECDLTERYWEEATNSCVCWSGEEINDICVETCSTSEDCKDNEVCEDHICIRIEQENNIETSDIILTSDVDENTKTNTPETTDVFETTPETTDVFETTTLTETTEIFETTHTYTPTTTLYPETTIYQLVVTCPPSSPYFEINNIGNPSCLTNCPADKPVLSDRACCPLDKPIWHGSKCISCVDKFGDKTPYWDGTQCTTCPSETPIWNGSQCVSCADHFGDKAPYWDGTQCTTCPSETPYWSNVKKTCVQCEPPTVFYIDRCLPCEKISSSNIYYNYKTEECEPCPLDYRQVGLSCVSCPSGEVRDARKPYTCISCQSSYGMYKNVDGPYWDPGTQKCVNTCPPSRPIVSHLTSNYYHCTECSIGAPVWNGTECITCSVSNPSTPYWDRNSRKCLTQCPIERPVWNGAFCETCSSPTPAWDGTKCTTCKLANPSTPYWDEESQQCLAQCPTERPYWDGTSCLSSCPTNQPYWNGSQCVSCSSQYGTNYYYNTDTKQCVYCANTWYQNKCFIPSLCSDLGLSQGYKIDSTNGGCYGLQERNKGFIAWCDRDHPGPCIVEASGYIVVPQSGTYTFFASEVLGDHGIINSYEAYIDRYRIYYTKNGGQEGSKEHTFSTYLSAGLHSYSVSFNLSRRIAAGLYSTSGNAMLCY